MLHKLTSLFFVMLLSVLSLQAQDTVEMADVMRSNGKIYVVVAVVAVVLIGLLLYMISIDRKVSKMEQKIKNSSKS